jgi:hypothetical protein
MCSSSIISSSPVSHFKKDISQVVQRGPQVDRVYQGHAGPVFMVELIEIGAREHEGGYLIIVEVDAGEVAAAGQQIGSQEDIGGLVLLDGDHLLDDKKLIFGRRCGRRRVSSAALAGGLGPINCLTLASGSVDGLFLFKKK